MILPHGKTNNDITEFIQGNTAQIQKSGVKSIGLFGSCAMIVQNDQSDVDLLAEFEMGKKTFDNYINPTYYLEYLFDWKVEPIRPDSLSKYIKSRILNLIEKPHSAYELMQHIWDE